MSYFISLFKDDIRDYILRTLNNKRPKKVIVCIIYHPDEKMTGSWADNILGFLGYNNNPRKLQAAIHQVFLHGTSKITIEGIEIVPFAMYAVLNGSVTEDYVQRVEPSAQGGDKLAQALLPLIHTTT